MGHHSVKSKETREGRPKRRLAAVAAVALGGLVIVTPVATPALAASPTAALAARQMTANDAGTDLRVTLNRLTQEHVYLAGAATGAAIGGRDAEFKAAAAELDENSVAIAQGIGSVYGPEAEQRFLALWRAHIGFFADYAMGAAKNDGAMKQQALANLEQYRMDVDALLTGVNPNLPKGAVAELFRPHVHHLVGAIDAQAAGNPAMAYDMLHVAAHQSREITDPLVDAIVAQFPERFGAMASGGGSASGTAGGGSTAGATVQGERSQSGDVSEGLSNDHPRGREENEDPN